MKSLHFVFALLLGGSLAAPVVTSDPVPAALGIGKRPSHIHPSPYPSSNHFRHADPQKEFGSQKFKGHFSTEGSDVTSRHGHQDKPEPAAKARDTDSIPTKQTVKELHDRQRDGKSLVDLDVGSLIDLEISVGP